MSGAFYIGATGLETQQRNLDTIAQNVANINTVGYKRVEMRFVDMVSHGAPATPGGAPDAAAQEGLAGVRSPGVVRVFSQGDLRQTGKPLDLAISGEGFIEVLGPGGQTYLWRGGSLRTDADGNLVTPDGLMLKSMTKLADASAEVKIGRDGKVRVKGPTDADFADAGQIELVKPDDVTKLEPVDGGYYAAGDLVHLKAYAPGEEGAGVLVQGSVETANVDLSSELVNLMLTQRAYGANAQVVQASDQLMSIANGLRR